MKGIEQNRSYYSVDHTIDFRKVLFSKFIFKFAGCTTKPKSFRNEQAKLDEFWEASENLAMKTLGYCRGSYSGVE